MEQEEGGSVEKPMDSPKQAGRKIRPSCELDVDQLVHVIRHSIGQIGASRDCRSDPRWQELRGVVEVLCDKLGLWQCRGDGENSCASLMPQPPKSVRFSPTSSLRIFSSCIDTEVSPVAFELKQDIVIPMTDSPAGSTIGSPPRETEPHEDKVRPINLIGVPHHSSPTRAAIRVSSPLAAKGSDNVGNPTSPALARQKDLEAEVRSLRKQIHDYEEIQKLERVQSWQHDVVPAPEDDQMDGHTSGTRSCNESEEAKPPLDGQLEGLLETNLALQNRIKSLINNSEIYHTPQPSFLGPNPSTSLGTVLPETMDTSGEDSDEEPAPAQDLEAEFLLLWRENQELEASQAHLQALCEHLELELATQDQLFRTRLEQLEELLDAKQWADKLLDDMPPGQALGEPPPDASISELRSALAALRRLAGLQQRELHQLWQRLDAVDTTELLELVDEESKERLVIENVYLEVTAVFWNADRRWMAKKLQHMTEEGACGFQRMCAFSDGASLEPASPQVDPMVMQQACAAIAEWEERMAFRAVPTALCFTCRSLESEMTELSNRCDSQEQQLVRLKAEMGLVAIQNQSLMHDVTVSNASQAALEDALRRAREEQKFWDEEREHLELQVEQLTRQHGALKERLRILMAEAETKQDPDLAAAELGRLHHLLSQAQEENERLKLELEKQKECTAQQMAMPPVDKGLARVVALHLPKILRAERAMTGDKELRAAIHSFHHAASQYLPAHLRQAQGSIPSSKRQHSPTRLQASSPSPPPPPPVPSSPSRNNLRTPLRQQPLSPRPTSPRPASPGHCRSAALTPRPRVATPRQTCRTHRSANQLHCVSDCQQPPPKAGIGVPTVSIPHLVL